MLNQIPKSDIKYILALLEDTNSGVRSTALKVLGQLGELSKGYIPQIAARLEDTDFFVRRAAVELLGQLGELSKDYIPQIAARLENTDPDVRRAAIDALGQLGELPKGYIPQIAARLEDTDPDVRRAAIDALGQLGELSKDYIPQIAARLENTDPDVRRAAVKLLAQLGELPKGYIPQIAARLEDTDPDVRRAAVELLGQLGELPKGYISQIAARLEDTDPDVRRAAIDALGQLGELSKDYIPQIAARLEDTDFSVRRTAVELLGQLGELSKDYIPQIAARLEDTDPDVHRAAIDALGQLGELSKDYIPQIAARLENTDPDVRRAAIDALGQLGELSKGYIPQIAARLEDTDPDVRRAAVKLLAQLGELSKDYIPQIAARLEDTDFFVRHAAIDALAQLGELSKDYIPQIAARLENTNYDVRRAAIDALGQLGELSKGYIPQIAARLEDTDFSVRRAAVKLLAQLGELPKGYIPQIAARLEDTDFFVRRAAVELLGQLGELSKDYIPQIAARLEDTNSGVRNAAVAAFLTIGEISIKDIHPILASIYSYRMEYTTIRFLAHVVGAGKNDIEILLKWLGEPKNNIPKELSQDEAKQTLQVFSVVWDRSAAFGRLRIDLARQIAVVVSQRDIAWTKDDFKILLMHKKNLDSINSTHVNTLNASINSITTTTWTSYIVKFWTVHVAFWLVLIFAYPKSTMIQAIFFWNPYLRKIMGLGYVNFALAWVPYLRQKLFAPFGKSLLADAELATFDDKTYFKKSKVKQGDSLETLPIVAAIPAIKGQIILEGESGLGKSMFVRHLLKTSKRIAVYLPAEKCFSGVMEAIQKKLHGVAKDTKFLRKLIFSGAIDIYIDGLNEVSAETRANLKQFVETYFRGNVLMATQPMEWKPPATAKRYILQPLEKDQVEEYLISRQKTLSKDIEISFSRYEEACKEYISSSLDTDKAKEELIAIQHILSNPMDLDIIAQMLAIGMEPDLFSLQKQQYQIMAADYEQKHIGNKFPLTEFSEVVHQMRLNDESSIPVDNYIAEINCMERHKMVLSRQAVDVEGIPTKDWFFRHDKIMDFFIVQSFLDNDDRPLEYIGDPRFRGVYFLLATLLPWDAAMTLREELIQYAADTKDVSISHKFIQLIRNREVRKAA